MNTKSFENIINEAWENKGQVNSKSSKKLLNGISKTIELLDSGEIRVAEKKNDGWVVNQWIKKAILLSFRVNKMKISKGPYAAWFDKIEGKTHKWNEKRFIKEGFRYVPNGVVRKGSFIARNVVLMPSFVNIGAYVDAGSMIDTWASVGSCAQVGKNCVVEGVIVGEGSVLSMGVFIGKSTKIVNRSTGEILFGKIPPYSVVVPGSLPSKSNPDGPALYCVVIIKQVDEKTRSKTSINDLLRE